MLNLKLGDTQLIRDECARNRLTLQQTAYVLATAKWETAHTMKPVRETRADTDKQAVDRLDTAFARGQLKWVEKPYWRPDREGKAWFGRGYVQLTHRDNYLRVGNQLGIDLVSDPSVALDPKVAAQILVRGMMGGWFTGSRLGLHVGADVDYRGARRVVNGTDKADEIAKLAREYEATLIASGPVAPPSAPSIWITLGRIIARIFGKGA